ncbi:hypothetical protein JCM5350_000137 [Sporobolomyces pararoseus]
MSFSSLPPELVHHIIELTVPHTFHSSTYQRRQRILCRLSLVSKLFLSIAQPLLLEIVWVNTVEEIECLPSDAVWRRKHKGKGAIRWAVVDQVFWRSGENELVDLMIEKFVSVATLTLANSWFGEEVDIAFLSHFESELRLAFSPMPKADTRLDNSDLSNLQLYGEAWINPQNVSFKGIRSLTLQMVGDRLFPLLVGPYGPPNLCSFVLVDSEDGSWDSARAALLPADGEAPMLSRLEEMNFDINLWNDPKFRFLHSKSDQTLVNCHPEHLWKALATENRVKHLRLHLERTTNVFEVSLADRLRDLAIQIQIQPSLPLQTIYFDDFLFPVSDLPVDAQRSMKEVTRVCQERKIDIVFDQFPEDVQIDPWLSTKFATRQKRCKLVS